MKFLYLNRLFTILLYSCLISGNIMKILFIIVELELLLLTLLDRLLTFCMSITNKKKVKIRLIN